MYDSRVTVLAALGVVIILGGLILLILPDPYEGPELYTLDEQHALRSFDGLGAVLLVFGCVLSWTAGVIWQRRVNGP